MSLSIGSATAIEAVAAQQGTETRIQPGDALWLMLADSTVIEGTLEALGQVPADRYQADYDQWRKESAARAMLPDLRAPIELVSGRMWAQRGLFGGFALGGVAVGQKNRDTLETIEFSRFQNLAVRGGRRWRRQDLERLQLEGEAPLLTTLLVRVNGDLRQVPLDDVVEIRRSASAPPLEPRAATFRSDASGSRLLAIEGGTLRVNNSEASADGLLMRVSPGPWNRRLGLDATLGVLRDRSDGYRLFNLDIGAIATVPVVAQVVVQPRIGVGAFFGSGGGAGSWNMGVGVITRLSRGFGMRVDYEHMKLFAPTDEWSADTFYLGPFWSR